MAYRQTKNMFRGGNIMAKKKEDVNIEDANVKEEDVEVKTDDKKQKVEIIRGRMPLALVALIKREPADLSTSALAAKYRTTVGKIDDIRKGHNFGYVDAGFCPTEDQAKAAADRINQLDQVFVNQLMTSLEQMGIATQEQADDFLAKRKAARKTKTKVETVSEGELEGVPDEDEACEPEELLE